MRTVTRDVVSALIISSDNKLLMGTKAPGHRGVYADCWHIPGGGVRPGEDRLAALHREVSEETHIDINNARISLADDEGRGQAQKTLDSGEEVLCDMTFNVYRVEFDEPSDKINMAAGDDLAHLEWIPLADLASLKHTPPSIPLFKRLGLL